MTMVQELDVLTCELSGINQIEASAGTGKTWNICGLYLRLLLERRLTVQQILVVTFTKAATAELRGRIRTRVAEMLHFVRDKKIDPQDTFLPALYSSLREKAGLDDGGIVTALDLALQTFDEAAIFTIHGFCQRAMSSMPFAAGLPLSFELVENDLDHKMEAVHDFWRSSVAGEALTRELAYYLQSKKDDPARFGKLLARSVGKPTAQHIWPENLIDDTVAHCGEIEDLYERARNLWLDPGIRSEAAAICLSGIGGLRKNSYSPEKIAQAVKDWTEFFQKRDPFAGSVGKMELLSATKLKGSTNNGGVTPQHCFFDAAAAYLSARVTANASLEPHRLSLIKDFLDKTVPLLRDRKRSKRVASFDDILYNLYEALEHGQLQGLAQAIRVQYPAALIDEFQDTDPLQLVIFQRIYAPEGPLFFVGDPKQSIYSFRGADLHSYLQAKTLADRCYSLSQNQRSTDGLIRAQNALFSANTRAFMLDGLSYTDVHCGKKPRKSFTDEEGKDIGSLQVWMLPEEGGRPIVYKTAKAAAVQATAAEIARLIADGNAGKVKIGDSPLKPGDIAVLVRSHAQGSAVRAALAELNVGSVELSQQSIFESTDAAEVELLLTAILEPSKTGAVHALLATEMMGFTAADVEALSQNETQLMALVIRLEDYRTIWQKKGFAAMYRRALNDEGVTSRMLRRTDGERRITNLLHLGELLTEASETRGSPTTLLRWLSAQRADGEQSEVAQLRLESDQNLVQILTIHKSKGLEYPVVFCPFLWLGRTKFPSEGLPGHTYHGEDGKIVMDFRDAPDHVDLVKKIVRMEESAEELRLAYVALTRAVYRCYIVAGCYSKPTGKSFSPKESCRTLLNWLVAGDGYAPDSWSDHDLNVETIQKAWSDFASRLPAHIRTATLPNQSGIRIPPRRTDPGLIDVRTLERRLALGWRLGSFSGMLHNAVHESAAVDHDARTVTAADQPFALQEVAPDDVLHFPKGRSPGDCMHAIFESIDFTDSSGWSDAVASALKAYPQRGKRGDSTDQQKSHSAMLYGMLSNVLQTEIIPGFCLSSLPLKRRRTELEFHMSARGVRAERLNQLMKRHGYACPTLDFAQIDGFLKGFVDLVFEVDEKFYVLDWKSTHLGYHRDDYAPVRCDQAMGHEGYHLQYLIYTLALHRFLQHRLPGYDYTRHFGGAIYLFVRGVRPSWRTPEGPCGVFHRIPSKETIAELDLLMSAE